MILINNLSKSFQGVSLLAALPLGLALLLSLSGTAQAERGGPSECHVECVGQKLECRKGCQEFARDCMRPAFQEARECRTGCLDEFGQDTPEAESCVETCRSEIVAPARLECREQRGECRSECHPGNCRRACKPGAESGPSECVRECLADGVRCAREGVGELRECRQGCRGLEGEAGETCRLACAEQVRESHQVCRSGYAECVESCPEDGGASER